MDRVHLFAFLVAVRFRVAREEKMLVGTALKHAVANIRRLGANSEAAEVIRDALVNLERRSKRTREELMIPWQVRCYIRLAGDAVLQIPNYLHWTLPPLLPRQERGWTNCIMVFETRALVLVLMVIYHLPLFVLTVGVLMTWRLGYRSQ